LLAIVAQIMLRGLVAKLTGTSIASVFGRFAVGAGSNIGPTFTWGFIAAKHAANASNIAG
jgi:3-oxosteroid 1-dehydrogenase